MAARPAGHVVPYRPDPHRVMSAHCRAGPGQASPLDIYSHEHAPLQHDTCADAGAVPVSDFAVNPCLKSQDISAPDYDGRRSKMTETPEILQHDLQTARTSMLIYRLAAGAALLL